MLEALQTPHQDAARRGYLNVPGAKLFAKDHGVRIADDILNPWGPPH